jgi:FKBP-type peptidyl-prolyl cis-trans isomerase FklB
MKELVVCLFTFVSATGLVNAQEKKAATKPAAPKATAKAVTTKPVMKNLIDSFSYAAGVNIANNMKEQGIQSLNTTVMIKAIDDVFKNMPTALSPEQCNTALQSQMSIFNKVKDEEKKKLSVAEKAKGEAFLANNKTRKEVNTLPSGLQYEILKSGDTGGMKPAAQDTVVVDYVGTLIDGKQFDASTGRGPATFPVNQVIKGWTEILQLMTKGDHWKVYIPSELGYGDRGAGEAIPAGATLIFEITLLDIKPAVTK